MASVNSLLAVEVDLPRPSPADREGGQHDQHHRRQFLQIQIQMAKDAYTPTMDGVLPRRPL